MTRAILFLMCGLAVAGIVDRVAVVIDNKVITESEVQDEVRLTEFLNNQSLDLSAAARKTAAERLVDQTLIHNEMQAAGYAAPSPTETDTLLRNFRQQRYPTTAAYQAALTRYGITEDQLKKHLAWEVAALRFTDLRFGSMPNAPATQSADRSADRAAPGESSVDQQMEAWLKHARTNSKIVFKAEAFQ
jgi:hypothetical protein